MAAYITPGDKLKVWIETSEGKVLELNVYSMEMSSCSDFNGLITTDLNLRVIDKPEWVSSSVVVDRLNNDQENSEWQCEYCGTPNDYPADKRCISCGAVRSFIYR